MSMVKRHADAIEDLRHKLEQIACSAGAIEYDGEETDGFLSKWDADAERHAYAKATISFRRGRLGDVADWPEIRDMLRDILDGARFGNLEDA